MASGNYRRPALNKTDSREQYLRRNRLEILQYARENGTRSACKYYHIGIIVLRRIMDNNKPFLLKSSKRAKTSAPISQDKPVEEQAVLDAVNPAKVAEALVDMVIEARQTNDKLLSTIDKLIDDNARLKSKVNGLEEQNSKLFSKKLQSVLAEPGD